MRAVALLLAIATTLVPTAAAAAEPVLAVCHGFERSGSAPSPEQEEEIVAAYSSQLVRYRRDLALATADGLRTFADRVQNEKLLTQQADVVKAMVRTSIEVTLELLPDSGVTKGLKVLKTVVFSAADLWDEKVKAEAARAEGSLLQSLAAYERDVRAGNFTALTDTQVQLNVAGDLGTTSSQERIDKLASMCAFLSHYQDFVPTKSAINLQLIASYLERSYPAAYIEIAYTFPKGHGRDPNRQSVLGTGAVGARPAFILDRFGPPMITLVDPIAGGALTRWLKEIASAGDVGKVAFVAEDEEGALEAGVESESRETLRSLFDLAVPVHIKLGGRSVASHHWDRSKIHGNYGERQLHEVAGAVLANPGRFPIDLLGVDMAEGFRE